MTAKRHIGTCSWSLAPKSPQDLVDSLGRVGLSTCQLALTPCVDSPNPPDSQQPTNLWANTTDELSEAGVKIASGMLAMEGEDYSTLETIKKTGGVASDIHWEKNLILAEKVADLASRWGINLVTFHAGFLPHDKNDPSRVILMDRLRQVAAIFESHSVELGFETGQETAETLLNALSELNASNVGVNFDPANMILYNMGDPVESLRQLADHVVQVHVKDAVPTTLPGTWGTEVPTGDGAVDWKAFFDVVTNLPRCVDLLIEREAGETREADIRQAQGLIQTHMPGAE